MTQYDQKLTINGYGGKKIKRGDLKLFTKTMFINNIKFYVDDLYKVIWIQIIQTREGEVQSQADFLVKKEMIDWILFHGTDRFFDISVYRGDCAIPIVGEIILSEL